MGIALALGRNVVRTVSASAGTAEGAGFTFLGLVHTQAVPLVVAAVEVGQAYALLNGGIFATRRVVDFGT